MSQTESQYDVIIIGAGETAQEAVAALKEQGKTALLIDLKPEMMTTMVCQSPCEPSSIGHPSSQVAEPTLIGDEQMQIWLHRHTLHTATSQTTTYTLQVQELPEVHTVDDPSELRVIEDTSNDEVTIEPEVIEIKQTDRETDSFTLLRERENSLREKLIRRKSAFALHRHPSESEFEESVYLLESIKIDDDPGEEENENQPQATYLIHAEERSPDEEAPASPASMEQPVYREREMKLRKRLLGKYRFSAPEPSYTPAKPSGATDENNHKQTIPAETPPSLHEEKQQISRKQTEVYSFEPFSSRRRVRSHKKGRFTHKADAYINKKTKHAMQKPPFLEWEQPPSAAQDNAEAAEPYEESNFNGLPFVNGTPKIQPFQKEPFQKEPEPEPEHPSNDALKRDNIEFEDAYGGYNSWEEFMIPFSENNRKRQEMDKIEKRKIALRGLHNLINNLG
ncbi:hypothetical protein [Lihuaxuella thermophila]|uniref:Glucose inhibited division protein A n=1 Tax=Lihuaxuella thermophila TaxID=1173111 RepID=A0A1H8BK47_9BACL|nr:hypothetical protein [Lihuaxuella thermophila]SEM83173.1 hypothetical protein SAMN05444955_102227 [Lihuaxuella thermophila]